MNNGWKTISPGRNKNHGGVITKARKTKVRKGPDFREAAFFRQVERITEVTEKAKGLGCVYSADCAGRGRRAFGGCTNTLCGAPSNARLVVKRKFASPEPLRFRAFDFRLFVIR